MTRTNHAPAIALCWLMLGAAVGAQDHSTLRFELTRPDAKAEVLSGRRLTETPQRPPDDAIRNCGDLQLSLRKIQYSETAGFFGYYLLVRHSDVGEWEEWLVRRDDGGRFTSQMVENVKVFAHSRATPDCDDFKLPVYCLAGCADNPWWALRSGAPKTLNIYVGAESFWNLLFEKKIPFPAKLTNPSLIMNTGEDPWRIAVSISQQEEGAVQLRIAPKWSRLQNILLQQEGLTARLTYRSEVNDKITEGVMMGGELSFPVVVKPEPWLLVFPLVAGSTVAVWIRRLGRRKITEPLREWGLVTMVAVIVLGIAFVTGSGVEVAGFKVSADGLLGAGMVGLTTGLAGRDAIDRLYKKLGMREGV